MTTRAPHWLMKVIRQARRPEGLAGRQADTASLLQENHLHTVCDGARCPNKGSCFAQGTATFMIMGDTCTRNCRFCAVTKGCPGPVDQGEAARLREAVEKMGLRHVVITSATRDDLPDGGAAHFADVIRELRKCQPLVSLEVLTPDFGGSIEALGTVLAAKPDVYAHNVETVPRLYREVRPGAVYAQSLALLRAAAGYSTGITTKSGFMLGLGETKDEVRQLLADLRGAGTAMVTIGQYLSPSIAHHPVHRYVEPEEYREWEAVARQLGFASVAAGPLVRSSYQAGDYYSEVQYIDQVASD